MSRSCWYTDKKCSCGSLIATNGKEEWCEYGCSDLLDAIKESNEKHEEMFKKLAE